MRCASFKSNAGHLEAAAAGAGLSCLAVGPLEAAVVAVNAQLRGWDWPPLVDARDEAWIVL